MTMTTIQRRTFLKASLLGTACSALPAWKACAAAAPPPFPIVDTHQHLWDLSKFNLPWVAKSKVLNKSFLTRDYLAASKGLNMVKAVYMEVAVIPSQQEAEAEWAIQLCRRRDNPTCAAVIAGQPQTDRFESYIRRLSASPCIKGVRSPLKGSQSDQYIRNIQLLGRLGLSFDICVAPSRLGEALKLVDRCPKTRFIIDHCGNADPKAFSAKSRQAGSNEKKPSRPGDPDLWRSNMAALAKRKNVVCKISGIVARMQKGAWTHGDLAPVINHCLDRFGPDRVMFASDWPVCTLGASLREWVNALKSVVRSRPIDQQKKLFHDNATAFYGLDHQSIERQTL